MFPTGPGPHNPQFNNSKRLWESQQGSDFAIVCQAEKFHVHKHILSARSTVFSLLFETEFSHRKEACIIDTNPDILRRTLEWMYTNNINDLSNINTKQLGELIFTADKYKLDDLKSLCLAKLCNNLQLDTFGDVLKITSIYGEEDGVSPNAMKLIEMFCHVNFENLILDQRFRGFVKGHPIFQTLTTVQHEQIQEQDKTNKKSLRRKWNIKYIDEIDKDKDSVKDKKGKNGGENGHDGGGESMGESEDDDKESVSSTSSSSSDEYYDD